jgi:nitroreductase
MVVAQSPSARELLAAAMIGGANAARVVQAPFSVVFAADMEAARTLGDLQRLERQAGKGSRYLRSLETDLAVFSSFTGSATEDTIKARVLRAGQLAGSLLPTVNSSEAWAFKNAALAAQTLMLGAAANGLGSCAMEGLDAHRVRSALAIPNRYGIAMVIAVGYEIPGAQERAPSPRYPLREAARLDRFDQRLESTAANSSLEDGD